MRITLSILAAALAAATGTVMAQVYPVKPIRFIVPSTPGGSVDTLARTVGPRLADKWGQQVIVDNRSGAGGAIAGELVAKSPPDGYTLLVGTVASLATNVSLQKKLPYDPMKDFAPVTLIATQNLMLLVHPSLPVKSVKELTALAKKKPGSLSFSSAGNGTGGHLSGELYKMLAGIDLLHVPYKGVAPAMIDVVSGQVTMTFASILSGSQQVKTGRLRALAVTGARRSPAVAELPTMMEAGVAGYESATWYGIVAPAGTPADIVNRLSSEIVAILKGPEMNDRLSKEGADPVGNTPAEFARHIQSEIEKWRRVIRAAGIQPS
ncbi:MAG: tripartite tricarboxylate transporter substrate binding protein [Burkholderiales bacterium]|nr:tripartite tricarboxylate transporter substrate binding protein [Burkholderiales bacterium]